MTQGDIIRMAREAYGDWFPTTPPPQELERFAALVAAAERREWQGLTEEDLSVCDEDGVILARYWEGILKEKNK